MAWVTQGRQHKFENEYGFVILCPLRSWRQLRPEVGLPAKAPVWLVKHLSVKKEHRGQGHGRNLLEEARAALPGFAGENAWLGLFSDNVQYVRKSSEAAQATWEAFRLAHPELLKAGGFVLVEVIE